MNPGPRLLRTLVSCWSAVRDGIWPTLNFVADELSAVAKPSSPIPRPLTKAEIHLAGLSPCRGLAPPAWDQRPFCMAFFSRLGRRDLFFLANFGIFGDFTRGAIWGAGS